MVEFGRVGVQRKEEEEAAAGGKNENRGPLKNDYVTAQMPRFSGGSLKVKIC